MSPAPPRRRAAKAPRSPIAGPLKQAIEESQLSAYALGQRAEVDRRNIERFLSGERSLNLETADRLAAALGFRLAPIAGRARPRAKTAADSE